ncbi:tyrosine-protein phosphatase [Chryseomicrobium palamuruense]|uniref:Tyrosine-protein phosphatase n=1 Tax=Chryseomicrobium palamuruense TaxID=682973 RepID=A0ABV8UUE9_9BACL
MIDMHAHIIWGVDDGPKTFEETQQLIRLAEKEGIEQIVATSHALHPSYHADIEEVKEKLQLLTEWIKSENIQMQVYLGHEIRVTENIMVEIKSQQVATLNNTNYVLIEFPSATVPLFAKEIVKQLVNQGYFPIIAHPERNKLLANQPAKLKELIDLGAYAQVTAGTIAGAFGKDVQKIALRMIDEGLIHCYGSDVHNDSTRDFKFDDGLSYLENKNRQEFVEYLLENNERLLENKVLLKIEKKETVLNRLFGFKSKKL